MIAMVSSMLLSFRFTPSGGPILPIRRTYLGSAAADIAKNTEDQTRGFAPEDPARHFRRGAGAESHSKDAEIARDAGDPTYQEDRRRRDGRGDDERSHVTQSFLSCSSIRGLRTSATGQIGDQNSADVFTEVSRGVD